MIRIEYNDADVSAGLARLNSALTSMDPVYQDIGELMIARTKANFVAGKSPDGVPWAPKSPATLKAYARRKGGGSVPIRPLFGLSGMLNSKIAYRLTGDGVEWGSPMVYAGTMQFGAAQGAFGRTPRGGPIPWGRIPARPFLGVGPEDQAVLLDLISDWLVRAGAAAAS